MPVTRRSFLKYCGLSAVALGLEAADLFRLEEVLANVNAPWVVWLQGASCVGCSVSFLDRISTTAPRTAAETLTDSINLIYHPSVMGAAGESAVAMIDQARVSGNYILVVEGGVPTAFGGHACGAWSSKGVETTFLEAVSSMAPKASYIICVGTCASFGGIPAAGPNPGGVKSVKALTGRQTINIAGCPAHPDWVVWAIVQLLLGKPITVDSNGRPTAIYGARIHPNCPLLHTEEAETFGVSGRCLKELGCRGPSTYANCQAVRWNNAVNWCIGAGAPCLGCTEPTFPGLGPLWAGEDEGGDD